MVRIICIGNRFVYPDNFGILVFEALKQQQLENIEVVEGGIGGMSLSLYFEDNKKILLVDYGTKSLPKIITNEMVQTIAPKEYDHANALLYLLASTSKPWVMYLCQEEFDPNDISLYVHEIITLAKEMV